MLRRGDLNNDGLTNAADIDNLCAQLRQHGLEVRPRRQRLADAQRRESTGRRCADPHDLRDRLRRQRSQRPRSTSTITSHIDSGFNNHLAGWANGDFDGNGHVDFDDYALIDLAFNTQGGRCAARWHTSTAAIAASADEQPRAATGRRTFGGIRSGIRERVPERGAGAEQRAPELVDLPPRCLGGKRRSATRATSPCEHSCTGCSPCHKEAFIMSRFVLTSRKSVRSIAILALAASGIARARCSNPPSPRCCNGSRPRRRPSRNAARISSRLATAGMWVPPMSRLGRFQQRRLQRLRSLRSRPAE